MTDRLDDRAVFAIVEQIYAAACDPALWPQVASECQQQLPGCGFSLLFSDSKNRLDQISCASGYDPHALADYVANYHAINPYVPLIDTLASDTVTRASTLVTREWLLAQPFYHEWLKPAGDFTLGATLPIRSQSSQSTLRVTFDVPSSQPHCEATAAEFLSRTGPHFRRAFDVLMRLRQADLSAATSQALLDGLAAPSLLVAGSGRLYGVSRGALDLLRQGRVISATAADKLVFVDADADASFRSALRTVTSRIPDLASTGFLCAVDGQRLPVIVLPVSLRPTQEPSAPTRLALVQIGYDESASAPPADLLHNLFNLTRSEAAVVQRVVEGDSIKDISDAHTTSQSTVRNQLQAAMHKLGVHRQAELVARLAALAPHWPFGK